MRAVQERLRAEAASRLRAAHPECAVDRDLTNTEELLAAYQVATTGVHQQDMLAVVVIGHFDLATWVRGTCDFALGVMADKAAAWRRSFTRTIFLSGNPKNLRERFSFAHVAGDEALAWTSPRPSAECAGLRRLLKLFAGTAALRGTPDDDVEVAVSLTRPPERPPVRRDLDVAVAGCTVADHLVHLNHLLVEAVFDGLIAPGDRLKIRRVPRLGGVLDRYVALRVATEQLDPGRLQAFAGLTEGKPLVV